MKARYELRGTDVWLVGGSNPHQIGELENGTLVLKRDPKKHVHRALNAYATNKELLDSGLVENIIIEEPTERKFVDVEMVKQENIVRNYSGEEEQYFIPLWLLEELD